MNKTYNTIDTIKYNLDATSAYFKHKSIYVSSKEFDDLISFESLPADNIVESYYWVTKLPKTELANFTTFSRKYVANDWRLVGFNGSTQSLYNLTEGRDYYWPLMYSTPKLSTNINLIGFDMLSNAFVRRFNHIALSSTNHTASFRVTIARVIDDNPYAYGIILTKNSFIDDIPDLNNTVGYSVGILHLYFFVNNNLKKQDLSNGLDVFIFDVTNDTMNTRSANISLLYRKNKAEYKDVWFYDDMNITKWTYVYSYKVLNRNWTIVMKYNDTYINIIEDKISVIIVLTLFGLLILFNIIICIIIATIDITIKNKLMILEENKYVVSNEMLSYVNHEIRNPLNVTKSLVQFNLEALVDIYNKQKYPTSNEFKLFISDLGTALGYCVMIEHIINDIVDVGKLESGKLTLTKEPINVHKFMDYIRTIITVKFDEKQTILFNIYVQDDIDYIYIDQVRITQIILNFLTNSIKFTDKGCIELNVYLVNDRVKFEVKDTGTGIPDEKKHIIFNPFSQVKAYDLTRHGGFGLGLYLCKMMATLMNADIDFTSEVNNGSTFWILFRDDIRINEI